MLRALGPEGISEASIWAAVPGTGRKIKSAANVALDHLCVSLYPFS